MIRFFCDLHLSRTPTRVHRNVAAWVGRVLQDASPSDLAVFGGDMLQSSDRAAFDGFISNLPLPNSPDAWLWLGGNRDAAISAYVHNDQDHGRGVHQPLTFNHRGAQCMLVNTMSEKLSVADFDCLAAAASTGRQLIVFSHWSLKRFDAADKNRLASIASRLPRQPLWIAGHSHESDARTIAGWHVIVCRGLDPFRTVGGRPCYLTIDIRDDQPDVQTHVIPDALLLPPICRRVRFGIAPTAPIDEVIAAARAEAIPAIQLQGKLLEARNRRYPRMLDDWRDAVTDPFLSIHLSQPHHDDEATRRKIDEQLAWSAEVGVNDVTAHLPKYEAPRYVDEQRHALTDEGKAAVGYYADLALRVRGFGATLSLENVHNEPEHARGHLPDRMSTRPWHMRLFIEAVRRQEQRRGAAETRVGMTFDSGHARNNGLVSCNWAPADWIADLGDLIQIMHAHQVIDSDQPNRMINHQTIHHLHERYINHEGLMFALASTDGPGCVVFAEVRDLRGAVQSWRTLESLSPRLAPTAAAPSIARVADVSNKVSAASPLVG